MKSLQRKVDIQVYLGYIWIGASLIILPTFGTGSSLASLASNAPLLLLAGAASWAGNLTYNIAIKQQPNLGYIEALSGIRLVVIFLASLFFFGAQLTPLKLLGLLGAAVAFALVSEGDIRVRAESSISWVMWSLISGVMIAVLIISVKVLSLRSIGPSTTIGYVFGIAGIMYFVSALISKKNLNVSGSIGPLLAAIAFAVVGNLALFMSYSGAPNLAYPEAISNGRLILLYLAAVLAGSDRVSPRRAIGVLLAFGSIVVLGL